MGENKEVKKAEYFDDRVYRISLGEGQYRDIASVTTKLSIENKPFLYKYYAELGWEQARRKLKEAGDRGSRIHYAFYIYNLGGVVLYNPFNKPNYSKEEIGALESKYGGLVTILENQDEMLALWKLQRCMEILKPKMINAENTVFSIKEDIAGTLDIALDIKEGSYAVSGSKPLKLSGGLYIGDLKTGNQVSESTWAQMAAYTVAYEEMYGVPVTGALCFHTSAQTKKGIEGFTVLAKTRDELKFDFEIYKHLSAVWNARNPNFGRIAFEFPTLITKREEI